MIARRAGFPWIRGAAQTVEADVVIIGGGISAAMVSEKLAETTRARIVVIEAGNKIFNLNERFGHRNRRLAYGENPWPGDHLPSQSGYGLQSRSMAVGGQALHWGGATPRFTPEDFRLASLYGVGDDWPFDYDELEPFYQEAEERIGVAGEQGPADLDVRSRPYPMPPAPLSYTLERLKDWAERSGIPFWANPVAKNTVPYKGRNVCARCDTCDICPTGAKYSPDFTFQALLDDGRIELFERTLVRRLVPADNSPRIDHAVALDRDAPDTELRFRAPLFVLAAGFTWSPHLLLLSAGGRFPAGLANSSGLVGKYMTGHAAVSAFAEVPERLYPGMYQQHSLLSKRFQRPGPLDRYVRHDLRVWEATTGRTPRLRNDDGEILWGDAVMDDWRARTVTGAARLRAYYDVLPARDSELVLDGELRNDWGDPMPRITFRDSVESVALREHTIDSIRATMTRLIDAGNGRVLSMGEQNIHDHPAGGCRAGNDPATSVVDSRGRAHDHENLFVVGAPTAVSGGCANGTLTFAALSLRSAQHIAAELPA
ncbi:MAG: GMC family oxidoreductase [Acidobacteriota bacterium]|jgi:quinoprotein glucose dehydrogenase